MQGFVDSFVPPLSIYCNNIQKKTRIQDAGQWNAFQKLLASTLGNKLSSMNSYCLWNIDNNLNFTDSGIFVNYLSIVTRIPGPIVVERTKFFM